MAMTDADIIHEYGLISPYVIIKSARLALLARVARKQPPFLTSILTHCLEAPPPKGWVQDIFTDLGWFTPLGGFGDYCVI